MQCPSCNCTDFTAGIDPNELTCTDCGTIYKLAGGKLMSKEPDITTDVNRAHELERMRELNEQITSTESIKKSMLKDYNDQLKDLKAELADILEMLKGL